jgi:hypothetical protein
MFTNVHTRQHQLPQLDVSFVEDASGAKRPVMGHGLCFRCVWPLFLALCYGMPARD